MKNSLVSIILPVYDADNFLNDCLDSLINQTYKNLEILIINDGSNDNSLKIIEQYANKDNRIKYVSRDNKGLIKTLNELVLMAKGDFIMRMDADDICFLNRVETQVEFMKLNDLDICGSWVEWFGDSNSIIFPKPVDHNSIEKSIIFDTPFWHPTVVFKKRIKNQIIYNENYIWAEDTKLWSDLILNGIKSGNISKALLKYRISSNQVSQKNSKLQRESLEKIKFEHLQKHPVYKNLDKDVRFWFSKLYDFSYDQKNHVRKLEIFSKFLHKNNFYPPKQIYFRFLTQISRKIKLVELPYFFKYLLNEKLNLINISKLILLSLLSRIKIKYLNLLLKKYYHSKLIQK